MPRIAREKSKSGIYHIMIRGINQQTIFEDSEDKKRFLETLAKFKEVSNFQLYGYCLMSNHVHLLLRECREQLSLCMKRISSSYVYWYNHKYSRVGHLFQERFKSEKVEDSKYFLIALRYIHQNPVKANLAKTIFDCKWTSLKEYLYGAKIVDTELALSRFSSDKKTAISLFRKFMNEENNDQCLDHYHKVRPSDDEVRKFLHQLGVPHHSALQRLEKRKRNAIIIQLKKIEGVSIRQLARVTGLSKSLIHKIK
jgi:putative transposase